MQLTNIVLSTTAGAVTFKPKSVQSGLSVLEDRSGGVAIGYNPLSIASEVLPQVRRTKLSARHNHLSQPAGADATGFTPGPRLDRFDEVDIIFKSNRRSNQADRLRMFELAAAMLADAQVKSVVVDEEEIV